MNILTKRVFAYIIDIIIVNLIIIFPFKPLLERLSENNKDSIYNVLMSNNNLVLAILVGLVIATLIIMYWAILEFNLGQSIGKMVFSLQVTTKNNKLKFKQCFIRNISKCTTILLILDSLYLFKSIKNQRYLEKISNTYVEEK